MAHSVRFTCRDLFTMGIVCVFIQNPNMTGCVSGENSYPFADVSSRVPSFVMDVNRLLIMIRGASFGQDAG